MCGTWVTFIFTRFSQTSCSPIGNVYLVANGRVGQVWNPCWRVRGVISGKKKKVNSITPKLKTCSVRVGGSLNLGMLTLLLIFSGSSRLGAEGFPELYLHWFLSAKAWNEHCAVLFPSAHHSCEQEKQKQKQKPYTLNLVSTYPSLALRDI